MAIKAKPGFFKSFFSFRIIIALGAMMITFLLEIYHSIVDFVYNPGWTTFKAIGITFFMFIFNSQQLLHETAVALMTQTLSIWEQIGFVWTILGTSLVGVLLIWGVYSFFKWMKADDSWGRGSRLMMLLAIILVIGFAGTFANYIENGVLTFPFHGYKSLFDLFKHYLGI